MSTVTKSSVLVACIGLLLTQGGVAAVRALYEARQIRLPRESVTNLPIELGEWRASEEAAGTTGMDKELLSSVAADDAVTRLYRHHEGWACSVHLAMWYQSDEWMPHPPHMCYDAAGFEPTQDQRVSLPGLDSERVAFQRYTNKATGQAVLILFWYQMGDRHYVNRDGSREVRRSYWGSRERPPLVKVLLQIIDREDRQEESHMMELASEIYRYASEL
jgi:hypothetical protein